MGYRTLKYMKKKLPQGYVALTKKEVQQRCMPILKEVLRIARKNKIDVYPIFGTALGAIRHKGFIPWDDDIDVLINAEDHEVLFEALKKEITPPFRIMEWEKGQKRIFITRDDYDVITSSFYETGNISRYTIDIFEFARFEKENDYKKIKTILGLLWVYDSKGGGIQKVARFFLKLFPYSFYTNKLKKRKEKYIKRNGAYEAVLLDDSKISWKSMFGEKNEIKYNFEDVVFKGPKNLPEFLEKEYGDWRKIPTKQEIDWNSHYFGEKQK